MISKGLPGTDVLVSFARIEALDWFVFAEQPVAEVYAKLYASIVQTALLLLAGLVISAFCALALARGMVRPIRTLADGAQRIGEGDLDQTIVVRTGDELEGLAERFNRMTSQLRESYAGLERKVEERTRELQSSLEQQTATSEVLKTISRTTFELQPVLETLIENATTLCKSDKGGIYLRRDDVYELAAAYGAEPSQLAFMKQHPGAPGRGSVVAMVAQTGQVVHMPDAQSDPAYMWHEAQQVFGFRSIFGVPMVREGEPVGVFVMWRTEVRPFSERERELVATFADQAVIAIQNVRLLSETREALDQQRASGEVLSAISSSIADTKPVFDKILESCERLFAGKVAIIDLLRDDGLVTLAAYHGPRREEVEKLYPHPSDVSTATGSVIASRTVVQYSSLDQVPANGRAAFEVFGIKSGIGAPMLWEGRGIGAIWVVREAPGGFSDKEVVLLRTFADQAVIAIQNARLVGEIQKKSEELEVANKHKSAFLASMSHELRTPLNAIIGFSEVLIERLFGELNEKQDDYLRDIHSSGRHLLNLINDVLDLSKVEAGRMELEPVRFDLPAALADAMTLIRERATRHGITLSLAAPAELGSIDADERKFKQILLNLLSNAVKFTPDGGRVEVEAIRDAAGVRVAVRDTGIGIAPEDQEAVFEEFRQVGADYTSKQEGTGLGLALTRRFVELHGGRIWVESAIGKGSTFYFTIPDRKP
jgi:signal transduction histidine kinase